MLASSHEKVFSAGANLGGFAADAPTAHKYMGTALFPQVFIELGELGKPSIVAASGHVLAGALGIALACDLIIAKDTAGFGTPEINVGLFPFMIMALIYRNVGRKRTNEMLLLGERLTAEQAREAGIVNKVVAGRRVRRRGRRLGAEAGLEVAAGDEAGQGRDVAPARHAAGRGARLPAGAADDRALDRGRDRGRDRVLREARPRMEGTLMSDEAEKVAAAAEEAGVPEAKPVADAPGPGREAEEAGGMYSLVEDLHERRGKAKLGGGPERIEKQHASGKLTARERIDLLVDEGTFVEMGCTLGRTSRSGRWRARRRRPTA